MGEEKPKKTGEIVSPVVDIFSLAGKSKPKAIEKKSNPSDMLKEELSSETHLATLPRQGSIKKEGETKVSGVLDLATMLKQNNTPVQRIDEGDAINSNSKIEGLEKEIKRLKRRLEREKKARYQSETTSEDISRALFIAQNNAKEANQLLESANNEMAEVNEKLANSMAKLTNAQIKRKALTITLLVAVSLFIITEFFLEAMLETRISNTGLLTLAKLSIFGTLFPLESFISKLLTGRISQEEEVNKSMYVDLLHSAYDDGIITEMERKLLESSRKQLGITATLAKKLENDVVKEKMVEQDL